MLQPQPCLSPNTAEVGFVELFAARTWIDIELGSRLCFLGETEPLRKGGGNEKWSNLGVLL
jgi:hypothetical protein